MIQRIDYVSLPVENLEEAVRFYGQVLGLPLEFQISGRWAAFNVGGVEVALYPGEAEEARKGDLAFAVEDLSAAMEGLTAAGVVFPHGVEGFDLPSGRGRLARFQDPSGNRLELVEKEGVRAPDRKSRGTPRR